MPLGLRKPVPYTYIDFIYECPQQVCSQPHALCIYLITGNETFNFACLHMKLGYSVWNLYTPVEYLL